MIEIHKCPCILAYPVFPDVRFRCGEKNDRLLEKMRPKTIWVDPSPELPSGIPINKRNNFKGDFPEWCPLKDKEEIK